MTIPAGIATAKQSHQSYVFVPLHCGVDNFMSVEDYEAHYWPSLKRSIDLLAPGSGYIMSNTVALDFVSPENMHAWRDATEKYGTY